MPVDRELRSALERWRLHRVGPFFEAAPPPDGALEALPPDFVAVAGEYGGCEGFLGDTYLRLYRLDELGAANVAYQVARYARDLVLFGSNGCGDAFALALPGFRVVQVPFIPLAMEHAEVLAGDFRGFVLRLAASGGSAEANPEALGLEAHAVQPVCLGGDPVSAENRALVPPARHAELAVYWNEVYARLRRR